MARRAEAAIKNATQRSRLEVTEYPHYESIAPGRVLGYIRKGAGIAGAWVVRVEVKKDGSERRRVRETIGTADDLTVANGTDILSYEQARALAGAFRAGAGKAAVAAQTTVADICEQHKSFAGKRSNKTLKNRQKAFDSLRFNVLRLESDGKTPRAGARGLGHFAVNALTDEILKGWRDALTTEKSAQSALRAWTDFHSCLEQAFKKKSNGIVSNAAWRNLTRLNQDHVSRQVHFTNDEAFQIIAAARRIDVNIADYFEGLFRTGARPGGELFGLRVCDFSAKNGNLEIQERNEVNTAKTGTRIIWLDDDSITFFKRLCHGRPSTAPLFTTDGENAFLGNSSISVRVKAVLVQSVNEVLGSAAPAAKSLVPYAFRHTFISRRLESGKLSAGLVAVHCGTSEWMIRKSYAKFCPSEIQRLLNESAPKPSLRLVSNAA